jgi:hypothetical protein
MAPRQTPLKRFFVRLKTWVSSHTALTYVLAGLGLVLASGLVALIFFWQQPQEIKTVTVAKPKPVKVAPKPKYFSPLTGELVADKATLTKPVTGIMIENSPSARPQSGLKDAEVVYEAVAEGGITRFLALYQQHQPDLIGPVRSLRMYYLNWATPYDASLAHVGGSYNALKTVRNGNYRDLDQFFNGAYYWRATDRYAPHNVYTSFSKLNQLNASKGYTSSNPIGFERANDGTPLAQDATSINLKISGPLYNSSYQYDPATKFYARSEGGVPHLDREAGQIQAKVVIALRVDMSTVMEDGYRENILTTGNGNAVIFQNGHAYNATWYKDSDAGQLRFSDAKGQPIALARGTTWISAIPNSGGDVSWQ